MTGLVIKLKPNEKILVNGVVLHNCDRASKFRVRSSDVSILRFRDAMPPSEANTPLKRIYYVAQLALAGEADPELAIEQIRTGIEQLRSVFAGEAKSSLNRALAGAEKQRFFITMRAVKKLFPLEQALLASSGKA